MSKPISREDDSFADRLHDELIDDGIATTKPISQQAARALLEAAKASLEMLIHGPIESTLWPSTKQLRAAIALAEKEGNETPNKV